MRQSQARAISARVLWMHRSFPRQAHGGQHSTKARQTGSESRWSPSGKAEPSAFRWAVAHLAVCVCLKNLFRNLNGTQGVTCPLLACSLQIPKMTRAGQAKPRRPELHAGLPRGCRCQSTWAILRCSPRCTSRETWVGAPAFSLSPPLLSPSLPQDRQGSHCLPTQVGAGWGAPVQHGWSRESARSTRRSSHLFPPSCVRTSPVSHSGLHLSPEVATPLLWT